MWKKNLRINSLTGALSFFFFAHRTSLSSPLRVAHVQYGNWQRSVIIDTEAAMVTFQNIIFFSLTYKTPPRLNRDGLEKHLRARSLNFNSCVITWRPTRGEN